VVGSWELGAAMCPGRKQQTKDSEKRKAKSEKKEKKKERSGQSQNQSFYQKQNRKPVFFVGALCFPSFTEKRPKT
jgi:Skp family chaperone for outer membrane proteins